MPNHETPNQGEGIDALIERASQGDEDAFQAICATVIEPLLRHAKKLCAHSHLAPDYAHDIAQESLMSLVANRPSFQSETHLKYWLRTTARNKAIDLTRRQLSKKRGAGLVKTNLQEVLQDVEEAHERIQDEDLQHVLAKVKELPPAERDIVDRYLAGLSNNEIANQLSVTEASVRSRFWRALNRLRNMV